MKIIGPMAQSSMGAAYDGNGPNGAATEGSLAKLRAASAPKNGPALPGSRVNDMGPGTMNAATSHLKGMMNERSGPACTAAKSIHRRMGKG